MINKFCLIWNLVLSFGNVEKLLTMQMGYWLVESELLECSCLSGLDWSLTMSGRSECGLRVGTLVGKHGLLQPLNNSRTLLCDSTPFLRRSAEYIVVLQWEGARAHMSLVAELKSRFIHNLFPRQGYYGEGPSELVYLNTNSHKLIVCQSWWPNDWQFLSFLV